MTDALKADDSGGQLGTSAPSAYSVALHFGLVDAVSISIAAGDGRGVFGASADGDGECRCGPSIPM